MTDKNHSQQLSDYPSISHPYGMLLEKEEESNTRVTSNMDACLQS